MRVFCVDSLANNSNCSQYQRRNFKTPLSFGQESTAPKPLEKDTFLPEGVPTSESGAEIVSFPNGKQIYLFDELASYDRVNDRDKLWGVVKAQQGNFGCTYDHTAVIFQKPGQNGGHELLMLYDKDNVIHKYNFPAGDSSEVDGHIALHPEFHRTDWDANRQPHYPLNTLIVQGHGIQEEAARQDALSLMREHQLDLFSVPVGDGKRMDKDGSWLFRYDRDPKRSYCLGDGQGRVFISPPVIWESPDAQHKLETNKARRHSTPEELLEAEIQRHMHVLSRTMPLDDPTLTPEQLATRRRIIRHQAEQMARARMTLPPKKTKALKDPSSPESIERAAWAKRQWALAEAWRAKHLPPSKGSEEELDTVPAQAVEEPTDASPPSAPPVQGVGNVVVATASPPQAPQDAPSEEKMPGWLKKAAGSLRRAWDSRYGR